MKLKKYLKALIMFMNRHRVRPVFVVGCGHSGTSIVISILDNHKDIYAIKKETSLFYESKTTVLSTVYDWSKQAKLLNKAYFAEKTPMHIYKINKMLTLFPKSRVVLMLRDGRDVACSIRARTGDYEKAIDKWLEDNAEGYKFWSHPRVKVVKLEELTKNGPTVLKEVCNFLGMKYQEDMLEKQGKDEKLFYTQKITDESDFNNQNASAHHAHLSRRNWQINQGLFANTQRWKEELSEEELEFFNMKAEDQLHLYGYQ